MRIVILMHLQFSSQHSSERKQPCAVVILYDGH